MSSLINPEARVGDWLKLGAGRRLPDPEASVGFSIDSLEVCSPSEMAAKGDQFLATARPEDAPAVALIRSVITEVENGSARIDALDEMEGKDAKEGPGVKSPEGSKESYLWQPDFLNWTGGRQAFSFDDGAGSQLEYLQVDDSQQAFDVYASKSGSAPATFVIFDREETTYTVFSQDELEAAQTAEAKVNKGLL